MYRCGTLFICLHNLDYSGANQVILNIIQGSIHLGNVVVLSPKKGPMSARFIDSGAAVRIGDVENALTSVRDVYCVICNTIMTAHIVCSLADNPGYKVIWIVHEWWTEQMIIENLNLRGLNGLDLSTVKKALKVATHVVCVCEAQRRLYKPTAPSSVVFAGVPVTEQQLEERAAIAAEKKEEEVTTDKEMPTITFLVLGIYVHVKIKCGQYNYLINWYIKS